MRIWYTQLFNTCTIIEEPRSNNNKCSLFATQATHWPCVKRYADTVAMSAVQAARIELEESETVTAMAGLSMQNPNNRLAPLTIHVHVPDRCIRTNTHKVLRCIECEHVLTQQY